MWSMGRFQGVDREGLKRTLGAQSSQHPSSYLTPF